MGCKLLARADSGKNVVAVAQIDLDDGIVSVSRLFLVTGDEFGFDFDHFTDQREEPGTRTRYAISTVKKEKGGFQLEVTETSEVFITDGPKMGTVTESDSTVYKIRCDPAGPSCDSDTE